MGQGNVLEPLEVCPPGSAAYSPSVGRLKGWCLELAPVPHSSVALYFSLGNNESCWSSKRTASASGLTRRPGLTGRDRGGSGNSGGK